MQTEFQKITEVTQQLLDLRVEHWLNETLFSFNWWVLLIATVGILVVWLIILDKKNVVEIIAYGVMITVTGAFADILGVAMVLWQYPYSLAPLPMMMGIHVIMMPVIYMIIYQYFATWKYFLIAMTINAFVFAFVLEPLLVWLHIYKLTNWNHIYSFVPYIVIGIVFKWLINQFKRLDQHYNHGEN